MEIKNSNFCMPENIFSKIMLYLSNPITDLYNNECYYSNLMSRLIINDTYINKVNMKYIYYYLLNNKEHIENNLQTGTAHKSLDIYNFNRMKLPIPSLEEQNKLVKYCENNDNLIKLLEDLILNNKEIASDLLKF